MNFRWVIVLSVALCSCESRNPSASTAHASADPQPDTAPTRAKEAAVIVLDQIQQRKGHVIAAPIRATELAASLTVPGRLAVNEDRTWHVGAIASGRIENISARVGDSVAAGQVLGLLHSHEVHEARAGYQEAITEVQRATAAEAYAKQRRERAQRLLELRAGSRQELEAAEADLRNAQAATQKAQSELEKERAHLNIFQVPADEPAASSSQHSQHGEEDDIPILAPASGLVFERKASVGSVVTSGEELFAITDTSSLWMIAAANESDLSRLTAGQQVHIQVRAYPRMAFSGRILKLGEKLDPDTRTLQIRILVPNPQGRLKPEMYATASLEGSGRHSALFVPEEAVQQINGFPVVFVRRTRDEFEARPVKTGPDVEGATEILKGLHEGDTVVVKGSFLLKSQMLKNAIQDSN
jgi:multidrug efflux pump subunit AcrA (membrane-fusion protein)